MKYVQPYGVADENAVYVNGNPATGIAGSIPPAGAFEYPQREIVAVINAAGISPSNGSLTQLRDAIIALIAGMTTSVPDRALLHYGVAAGSANALTVNATPAMAAYQPGSTVIFVAGANNTAAVTLSVNSGGVKPLNGPDGVTPLSQGDLVGGQINAATYDGTAFRLIWSSSPSFVTKVYNQIQAASPLPKVSIITASGNFVPTGSKALVIATGGGGAGGGSNNTEARIGGGGGAGATAISLVDLIPGVPVVCAIGAGGAPSAGSAASETQSGSGGTTSFGSLAVAGGGQGGTNSTLTGPGWLSWTLTHGRGGSATAGTMLLGGGSGQAVANTPIDNYGGAGGASFWGGGAGNVSAGTGDAGGLARAGNPGQAYGSGGGGGDSGSTAPAAGGAGAPGIIFILELR